VGKPERKGPFARPINGWEDSIKMDVEVAYEGVD
jgi:hypothetical protein